MNLDTRYNRLLDDEDDNVYQPPRFHTIATSTIQDLGRRPLELSSIDLLSIQRQYNTENDAFDKTLDLYLNVNTFDVKYLKFPLELTKKQVRCKGQPNQMRLHQEDAKVKLLLTFQDKTFGDVCKIKLLVRRLNAIPNYIKLYTGFVTLDPVEFCKEDEESPNKVAVYANLDHLEEGDDQKKIYELSKSNPEYNQFTLYVEVLFYDGSISNFTTRSFSVKGQKNEKRRAPDSPVSVSSSGSSIKSPRLFEDFCDPNENKNFANHQKLVCEIIEAKQGIFENLKANVIKSGKGDIAYHFVLKDQTSRTQFEPGEIIGFTTDDTNGKVVIDKLAPSNASKAFLKGVVTESQYMEAFLPQDRNVITATICMLGVVPIRVMGPVLPGEGLYASQDKPGIAISERLADSSKAAAHIGYAFESMDCENDEVNDIQGLVSIISSAGQDLCVRQLSNLESSLKHSIRFNTVRSRKCFTLLSVITLVICILLGTVIYQVKGTGTLYRKWMCKQGSSGYVKYWYWLQGGEYVGYQFKSCDVVWERTINKRQFFKRPHSKHAHARCINATTKSGKTIKFNYYINIDSCSGVLIPGSRYMFAVDGDCNSLYLFDEVDGNWRKDRNVCFQQRCNIICNDTKRHCHRGEGWNRCPDDESTFDYK